MKDPQEILEREYYKPLNRIKRFLKHRYMLWRKKCDPWTDVRIRTCLGNLHTLLPHLDKKSKLRLQDVLEVLCKSTLKSIQDGTHITGDLINTLIEDHNNYHQDPHRLERQLGEFMGTKITKLKRIK